MSIYGSLDLIKKDFITQKGVYQKYYRGYEVYIREAQFDVNGRIETVDMFPSDSRNMEKGQLYEFTYAKRTDMLLDIRKCDE